MTRLTADIYGHDPNNGDAISPSRKVEVEVGEQMLRVRMQVPGIKEAFWPDLMIEWQPALGWCVYVHPNNNCMSSKKIIIAARKGELP
jgi:hypothetical protein